jgi:hypothetical protein
VERVQPRLVPVPGGFQVRPMVDGLPTDALDDYFYETGQKQLGRAPLKVPQGEGKKAHVVFSRGAQRGLARCRALGNLPLEKAAQALSQPETFFGEDLDVSSFCERVVGLGPEVRRVFPTAREHAGNDWWNWDGQLRWETPANAQTNESGLISLREEPVRRAVVEAVRRADAQGERFFVWPGSTSLVEITAELRETLALSEELAARGTWEQPGTERRAAGEAEKRAVPRQVLQVHENIENLSFARDAPATDADVPVGDPPGLRGVLHDYQAAGFRWLVAGYLGAQGRFGSGALLADDMGLGKSLQVLSLLAWLRERGEAGPHLVVAPAGLLDNWQRECHKFFGGALEPVLQVSGAQLPEGLERARNRLAAHQVVLVSYETLRRHELTFATVQWRVMVLDEAQKAKDPSTQIARVVRAMSARFRVALSGTPVENSLRELWTICDWAVPGRLGSLREFSRQYISPLADRTVEAAETERLSVRLQAQLGGLFLRRLKSQVLAGLPPLHHQRHEVALSEAQEDAYARAMAAGQRSGTPGAHALARLGGLFAACAHPRLAWREAGGELPSLAECAYPRGELLLRLLDAVAARGEKALLFAGRRLLQAWLAREVEQRYGGPVEVINGLLDDSKARSRAVDAFSARPGFAAMVLSPRAAGVGLNITAANHVFHYTREWNPAIENQATDRAYRIGQERPVHVHYFTAVSRHGQTVEQVLGRLLERKAALLRNFVVPMGQFAVEAEELEEGIAAGAPADFGASSAARVPVEGAAPEPAAEALARRWAEHGGGPPGHVGAPGGATKSGGSPGYAALIETYPEWAAPLQQLAAAGVPAPEEQFAMPGRPGELDPALGWPAERVALCLGLREKDRQTWAAYGWRAFDPGEDRVEELLGVLSGVIRQRGET